MAKILDMPKLSPTMEEGILVAWHKNEGDSIAIDDLLAEVETDKATMEFRAFDAGTLLKILVEAGANVKLGQAVAIVGAASDDIADLAAKAAAAAPAPTAENAPPAAKPAPSAKAPAAETKPAAPQGLGPVSRGNVLTRTERDADMAVVDGVAGGRVLASPYIRKVARERGIDLTNTQGSGEHGRIVPADLDTFPTTTHTTRSDSSVGAQPVARAPETPAFATPEARPLSQMRKTIARRLVQSKQTVPHFYLTIDVNAEPLAALRELVNTELAAGKKKTDEKAFKVSLNDLLVRAVATALVRVPECNAQFSDDAILIHRRIDISVAVAVPDGLVTPVVRRADQKSVVTIAREIRDLASRARMKKLKPEEMQNGTFSISNLGMFGIDEFSAVINPPEGAILAVGQVRSEPVVQGGVIAVGKKLSMTLSCDHRVIDGAVGAAFLAELRSLVEHPMQILTG